MTPLLPAVLLLGVLVACGADRGNAGGDGDAGDSQGPAPAPAGQAEKSPDGDRAGTSPSPQLAVDRRAEPAPAALPPVGDIVELQGAVASWPQPVGTRVRAAVGLQIADGFHVNANPPAEEWIIPTELRLEETPGVSLAAVHYPQARAVSFDFWAEPLDVWEGTPVAGLELDIDPDAVPGERTARIVVRYQACNDEACFRPMEATLRMVLEIAPEGASIQPVESPLLDRAPFPQG